MQMAWGRGFFRLWVVLAVIWIAVVSWTRYPLGYWGMDIRHDDGCSERFGHWPDGKAFEHPWDIYPEYPTSPDALDRNRWREATAQKIQDCHAASLASLPVARRREMMIEDNWADVSFSLALIFLPPIALSALSGVFRWVVAGFKPSSS
jgi:hypothetical protein